VVAGSNSDDLLLATRWTKVVLLHTRTAVVEEGEQQKLGATEKRRSCKIEPIVLQMG
jgi:hypothetical protein